MHVLLCPVGSHGDVHPFVGFGRGLVSRGHRVTLVTSAPFRDLAVANGFDFAPVGMTEDYESLMRNPDVWHPSRSLRTLLGAEWFGRCLREMYEHITTYYIRGETVVVAGTLALGARLAHDALGVPLATVHLQPLSLPSAAAPPAYPQWTGSRHVTGWVARLTYQLVDRFVFDPLLAPSLNRLRADLGLPPVRRVWGKWRHAPQREIGLFPSWFGSAPDWPPQFRQTGFIRYDQAEQELPPALRDFLDRERPVVFSFGSAMRVGRRYFEAAIAACKHGGFPGLLLAKGGDQVPTDLPPRVAHFEYAPFSLVFPRAKVVVHHGGIGTTAQALAAGVPQLIMPLAFDQPDNALRVRRLGVGTLLPPKRFTPTNIIKAVAELSDPKVVTACGEYAARLAADDPLPETCRLIEELQGADGPIYTTPSMLR